MMDPKMEIGERVLRAAALAFEVTVDQIMSRSRLREVSDARKAIVHILTGLNKNPGRIAKLINKNHCGISYMRRGAMDLLRQSREFKACMSKTRAMAMLDDSCPCCGRPYEKAK